MSEVQMLFPIEPREFWQKLKVIVEQVMIENDKRLVTGAQVNHQGKLMKAGEVCAHLRITKPTLYDWMSSGKLPSIKIGSRRYFKWEDVEKLVESGRTQVQILKAGE